MQNFTRLSWATGTSHGRIKHRFKHFQALYQELLISKALLKLPFPTNIGRSANLFTFCHSHMQHPEPTPAQCLRRVQKADKTLSQQKYNIDFNEINLFLHLLFFFVSERIQGYKDCLFLFGSLSFPSVQQLGKIQHVLTKSGNSFI